MRKTFGSKMMLIIREHGIYTEENTLVRTSIQNGNMLIENRRWRGNLLARNIVM